VMELLHGEDLNRRMKRGRVGDALIYQVVREVGGALAVAHKNGIVHRDLKPPNIFLAAVDEAEGVVEHCKVLDFGISKMADATVVTHDAAVLGTPRYMSPEQALGNHADIDGRSDQYALAAVAWELFAGRPAFDAAGMTAILYKVVHEQPPSLRELAPGTPDAVVVAIERAMSKLPAARFPDMTAFVRAVLDGAPRTVSSAPIRDTPDDISPREAVPARGRTIWIAAGAGLLGALGIAVLALQGNKLSEMRSDVAPAPLDTAPEVVRREITAEPPLPNAVAPAPEQPSGARVAVAESSTTGAAAPLPVTGEVPRPTERADTSARAAKIAVETTKRSPLQPETAQHVAERPEVAQALDEAERLLGAARYFDAVNKARQSLGLQETPRARALIVAGYCAMSDLGNAKAALPKVAPSDRRRLLTSCKQAGVDLE